MEDVPFLRTIFDVNIPEDIDDEGVLWGIREMRKTNPELYMAAAEQCRLLKNIYRGIGKEKPGSLSEKSASSIFSLLSEQNERKKHDEVIYKLKLTIVPPSRYDQFSDLKIGLYVCKMLKNGNPSKGKELFRSRSLPDRFKKLAPFLQERSSGYYYNSSGMDELSFRTAPDFFVSILISEDIIYEEKSDLPVTIDQHYRFSSKIEKEGTSYRILGVLTGKDGKETGTTGMTLMLSVDPHTYALYESKKKRLMFFRTEESASWVRAIFAESLLLTEQDKIDHEQTPEFEKLIRAVKNPEVLGIEMQKISPK